VVRLCEGDIQLPRTAAHHYILGTDELGHPRLDNTASSNVVSRRSVVFGRFSSLVSDLTSLWVIIIPQNHRSHLT